MALAGLTAAPRGGSRGLAPGNRSCAGSGPFSRCFPWDLSAFHAARPRGADARRRSVRPVSAPDGTGGARRTVKPAVSSPYLRRRRPDRRDRRRLRGQCPEDPRARPARRVRRRPTSSSCRREPSPDTSRKTFSSVPSFLRETEKTAGRITRASRKTLWVFGSIVANRTPSGRSLFNVAVAARTGRAVAVYRKRLLSTYDVFDEGRFFEPGDRAMTARTAGRRRGPHDLRRHLER